MMPATETSKDQDGIRKKKRQDGKQEHIHRTVNLKDMKIKRLTQGKVNA